ESATCVKQPQETEIPISLIHKKSEVNANQEPLAPTLESLKGRGGLVPFLPQHCQPLYANGKFPEVPPANPPPGFMLCIDQPEELCYADGAFIEPSLDEELFPDVSGTEPYALVLILVKQIMV